MPRCKHCGEQLRPREEAAVPVWVHYSTGDRWCHERVAVPGPPTPGELRELHDLGWSATGIARRYQTDRHRIARAMAALGLTTRRAA